ncbi:Ribophorin I [Lipomyces arxii]|uniref:Ribophorin I n=1 Tax=Lipomyces arxii TaxID=56418 RepID=UPI0034CF005F
MLLGTAESTSATLLPEPLFRIQNLLRTVDLTKSYLRESLSFIVENIASVSQTEFYIAVPAYDAYGKVVILEVKEKRDDFLASTNVELVPTSEEKNATFYKVSLVMPLAPGQVSNIQVATAVFHSTVPQPKAIKQPEAQFLLWRGSRLTMSPYEVVRQRMKVKVSDKGAIAYSKSKGDPVVEGSTLTYGPYMNTLPYSSDPIAVRYEYHFPLVEVTKLKREFWVSHYGGVLETEENYWMTNAAAKLSENFSRLRYQASTMTQERSTAIRGFNFHLLPGARDVYFTDEIGNVSTSNFRPHARDPTVEVRPRYPIFGGWNYTFTLGWNHDLGRSLKVLSTDERNVTTYLLRVPFVEGPDNTVYDTVEVSVVLPEGAKIVDVSTSYKDFERTEYYLKSQLDTIGRTVVKLTAHNVVDEHRRNDIYVTYEYSSTAILRKPALVSVGLFAIFLTAIIFGRMNFRISK